MQDPRGKPFVYGVVTRVNRHDCQFVQIAAGQLMLRRFEAKCLYGGPSQLGDVLLLTFTRKNIRGCEGEVDEYEVLSPSPYDLFPNVLFSKAGNPLVQVVCVAKYKDSSTSASGKSVGKFVNPHLGYIYDDSDLMSRLLGIPLQTGVNYLLRVQCVPNFHETERDRPPFWQIKEFIQSPLDGQKGPYLGFCMSESRLYCHSEATFSNYENNANLQLAGNWVMYNRLFGGRIEIVTMLGNYTPVRRDTENGYLIGLCCSIGDEVEDDNSILYNHLVGRIIDQTDEVWDDPTTRRRMWCTVEEDGRQVVWTARRSWMEAIDGEDGWNTERDRLWADEQNRLKYEDRKETLRALSSRASDARSHVSSGFRSADIVRNNPSGFFRNDNDNTGFYGDREKVPLNPLNDDEDGFSLSGRGHGRASSQASFRTSRTHQDYDHPSPHYPNDDYQQQEMSRQNPPSRQQHRQHRDSYNSHGTGTRSVHDKDLGGRRQNDYRNYPSGPPSIGTASHRYAPDVDRRAQSVVDFDGVDARYRDDVTRNGHQRFSSSQSVAGYGRPLTGRPSERPTASRPPPRRDDDDYQRPLPPRAPSSVVQHDYYPGEDVGRTPVGSQDGYDAKSVPPLDEDDFYSQPPVSRRVPYDEIDVDCRRNDDFGREEVHYDDSPVQPEPVDTRGDEKAQEMRDLLARILSDEEIAELVQRNHCQIYNRLTELLDLQSF